MANITVKNGEIYIDETKATNEQIASILDYSSYTDENAKRYVEGILNNDSVKINDITYSTKLDSNGNLVSSDGSTTLDSSKIKEYFGNEGYNALVCKSYKDIKVSDGKVVVNDLQQEETPKQEDQNDTPQKENEKSNDGDDNQSDSNKSSSDHSSNGSSNSSSSGSSGTESSAGTSSPSTESTNDESSGEEKEEDTTKSTGGTKKTSGSSNILEIGTPSNTGVKILFDFENVTSIEEELNGYSKSIEDQIKEHNNHLNDIINIDAWTGEDSDYFGEAKTVQIKSLNAVTNTFNNFNEYLEKCYKDYENIENKLSKKFS